MGIFDGILDILLDKNLSFKDPIFIKDFNEKNEQIIELEKLLKEPEEYDIKKIENDLKMFNGGMVGEKNVAYELKNSHMPILILHNLYLKYEELTAQIDYVVIGQKFILIVECKNMVGDIEVNNNGEFIRHYKNNNGKYYKKEGMYSPITQNERHLAIVKDILLKENILKESLMNKILIHRIVVANPKTIINSKFAKKNVKEQIIKLDQLINTLRNFNDNNDINPLSEDIMRRISSILLQYNSEKVISNTDKYKINKQSYKKENVCNDENIIKQVIEAKDSVAASVEIEDYTKKLIENDPLYTKLREYRYNKSKEEKVKPYFIYNNFVMEELIKKKPKSIDELRRISGFGPVKCEKYGQDIINIVMKK